MGQPLLYCSVQKRTRFHPHIVSKNSTFSIFAKIGHVFDPESCPICALRKQKKKTTKKGRLL